MAFASARPIEERATGIKVTFEVARRLRGPVSGAIRASHLRLNRTELDTEFSYPYEIHPYEFQLLANYPNPFNPETWIPFELAEDADITIRIYGVTGRLVRALDLGFLPMGEYRSRGDAAYWDGANRHGERVASGVYVYELAAGHRHSMRRMVVQK